LSRAHTHQFKKKTKKHCCGNKRVVGKREDFERDHKLKLHRSFHRALFFITFTLCLPKENRKEFSLPTARWKLKQPEVSQDIAW
jgi:hypothetical protein